MYENILLPTDGSEGAGEAVEHAASIAGKFDSTIHVVYVVDLRATSPHDMAEVLTGKLEDIGKKATQTIKEELEGEGLEVKTYVEKGIPHKTIMDLADRQDIDLIIMGTHGRTGLDRIMLGSVTEKVVRKSKIPVLTVGPD